MAFALARTRALVGLTAPLVSVEVHLSGGLPRTSLVGLPAAAVRESKDRVRAALVASDFQYPNGRVVINLGPADLPKEGGRFDLPIALGILAASGQLPAERLAEVEVIGELSLNGRVQSVRGAISCAVAARESARGLILPAGNAREAAFARAVDIFPISHLAEARGHLLSAPAIRPFSASDPGITAGGSARHLRRAGTGDGQAGPRSGRGGRSPRPHGGPSRHREDHARLPSAGASCPP